MVYSFQGVTPKIHPSVFQAPNSSIVGHVELAQDCSVWFNVVIRGDVNSIQIGSGTNIQDGSILHVTYKTASLKIGANVTIGHMAMLHGCTIEDFVLIGMRATVMDHAEIGKESLIGAGALVIQGTKIPPRTLAMGSPAKVIRPLTKQEIDFLHQSAENYKQYVKWYREGGFTEKGQRSL